MHRWWFAFLSGAGVALTHTLTYALLPQADAHAGVGVHLEPGALAVAGVATLLGLLVMACGHAVRGGSAPLRPRGLVAVQLLAFAALEGAEHVVAAGSLAGVANEPALWLGLLLQIAVAMVLLQGLEWIPAGVAVMVRRDTPAPDPRPQRLTATAVTRRLLPAGVRRTLGSRAPPLPSLR